VNRKERFPYQQKNKTWKKEKKMKGTPHEVDAIKNGTVELSNIEDSYYACYFETREEIDEFIAKVEKERDTAFGIEKNTLVFKDPYRSSFKTIPRNGMGAAVIAKENKMSQYDIRLVGSIRAEFEDYPTEKQVTEYLRKHIAQEIIDTNGIWTIEDVVDA